VLLLLIVVVDARTRTPTRRRHYRTFDAACRRRSTLRRVGHQQDAGIILVAVSKRQRQTADALGWLLQRTLPLALRSTSDDGPMAASNTRTTGNISSQQQQQNHPMGRPVKRCTPHHLLDRRRGTKGTL
jgi:hypothetical protein